MNGTKWYKLNKSNEPLEVFLEEQFAKLESEISRRISSEIANIGGIIFSAGLTFALGKDADPFRALWCRLPIYQETIPHFIMTALSCAIIFLFIYAACRLALLLIGTLIKLIKDDKASTDSVYILKKYFYKKVLNDLITGISLEKKSYELSQNMDQSATPAQDSDLYMIYLMESTFYFNEAIRHIRKRNLVEINNCQRKEYTAYLESMNPDVLCSIFSVCISTLDRVISGMKQHGQSTRDAQNARRMFENYVHSIHSQMNDVKVRSRYDE